MATPANAVAEIIEKLRLENEMISSSIVYQQELHTKNEATIAELEPLAEWTE